MLQAGGVSYFNGGNVGIGTNTPGSKLHVYGGYITDEQTAGVQTYLGSTASAGYLQTSGTWPLTFYAGGTQAMTILNSGNVGIGVTNPSSKLDIEGAAGSGNYLAYLRATDNGGGIMAGSAGSGTGVVGWSNSGQGVSGNGYGFAAGIYGWGQDIGIQAASSGHYGFYINSSPAPTYDFYAADTTALNYFAGKVGIGTTNPQSALHISGSGMQIRMIDTGANTGFLLHTASGIMTLSASDASGNFGIAKPLALNGYNSGHVMVDTLTDYGYNFFVSGTAGGTGSWQVYSDARFKKNVEPLTDSLDKVMQLQGVSYYYNTQAYPNMNFGESKQIGFIAQDVEKVIPEVVSKDNKGYESITYDKMSAVLVEAIKEQQTQIETLKTDNQNLQTQVDSLNSRLGAIEKKLGIAK
jgi:hypothetical protein